MPAKILTNTPFHPGMTSDHALQVAKASRRGKPYATKIVGQNEHGGIVKWYFTDCTLTFSRLGSTKPYTCRKVEEKQDPKNLQPVVNENTVQPGTEEYAEIVTKYKENAPHGEKES